MSSSAHPIKHILVVSFSTLGSRLLGLLRDIVIFSFLGTSALNAAFLLAFTLPNLFRRLLGEGALSSAFVPVFSELLEKKGPDTAHAFLNATLTRVTLLLIFICTLSLLCLMGLPHGLDFLVSKWPSLKETLSERWYMASKISQWLMPYMPCVCLAAIVSAALNVYHRFAMGALAPIFLNLSMLLSLVLFATLWATTDWEIIICLSTGVLIGGTLQLILPIWGLKKMNWHFQLNFKNCSYLEELKQLFFPALAGAAIFQINILVSRLLAFSIDDASISLLYLAGRLVELPLGMFTLSVATVVFPQLSRLVAQGHEEGIAALYGQGLRLVLAITVPATIGLMVLAHPILHILFKWGAFSAEGVALAIPVLALSSLGIPLYSWATLSTRGFHAFKDTSSPVKIAFWTFLVNVLLSLIFMHFWAVNGLALANVLSVAFQAIALHYGFWQKTHQLKALRLLRPILQIASASAIMACFLYIGKQSLVYFLSETKLTDLLSLLFLIPGGIAIYCFALWAMHFEDLRILKDYLFQFLEKKALLNDSK